MSNNFKKLQRFPEQCLLYVYCHLLSPLCDHAFIIYWDLQCWPCENCPIHIICFWQNMELRKGYTVVLSRNHIKLFLLSMTQKVSHTFQPQILFIFCINLCFQKMVLIQRNLTTDAFNIIMATLELISPIINYFIVYVVYYFYCFMSVIHKIKIIEIHEYC